MAAASTGLNPPFAAATDGPKAGGHPAVLGARQPLTPLLPSGLPAAGHRPPRAAAGLPRGAAPCSLQQPGMTKLTKRR